MQLFRSEEDVRAWSARTGQTIGAEFELAKLWTLAQSWYDDRLDPDWRRRTVSERQALLTATGLTGPFWEIG